MSDFLADFVNGPGCAADGSAASANPMGHLMNSIFEGPSHVFDTLGSSAPGSVMLLHDHGEEDLGPWSMAQGAPPPFFSVDTIHQGRMGSHGTTQGNAQFAELWDQQMSQGMHPGPMLSHQHHNQQQPYYGGGGFGGGPMSAMSPGFGQAMHMQQLQYQMASMSMQQSRPAMNYGYHHQHHPPPTQYASRPYMPPPAQFAGGGPVDGLQQAAAGIAQEFSTNADPKYAQSEFGRFAAGLGTGDLRVEGNTVVGRSQHSGPLQSPKDVVLAHAGAAMEGAEAEAAAAEAAATEGASFEDGLPEGIRMQMEAAFSDAMASSRADDEAEQAEYAAMLGGGLGYDPGYSSSAYGSGAYGSGRGLGLGGGFGENAAWARTAAALESLGDPALQPYAFGPAGQNCHLGPSAVGDVAACFEEGRRLLHAGRVPEAVEALEAVVQRDAAGVAAAEAWTLLGQCHAEQDEDRRAIQCLERAVAEDPYNLDALLALGVSYVNELDSPRALRNLKTWVQHNPLYHGLEIKEDEYSDGSLMDEVMQLMLQAAEFKADDADVQVVLGVLYNVSRDFGAAADALAAAAAGSADHAAWNKLGATLANSNRSEEALPAYHKALALKPRYARGWLNLAISHANLSHHDAAARCYLQALDLNPGAAHIWNYLRLTLGQMDRYDLIQAAARSDVSALRDVFPPIQNDDPTTLLP